MINEETAKQLLNKLYKIENDDEFQAQIASIKAQIENLGITSMFIEERVKGPISALKKFTENKDGKYQEKWNAIKDLFGLMVVVDNNYQVDYILNYIKEHFSKLKNPYVENFITDYRKVSNRKSQHLKDTYVFQDPQGRSYQTNDSYKTTKANLMIDQIPIEIQVKTKAQYIAHMATHDSVYKTGQIEDKDLRYFIADKMFPYFETFAYLRLNKDNLTQTQIKAIEDDIKEIFTRNFAVYNKYANIFNEARCLYGVNFYLLQNRDAFIKDSIFHKKNLNMQISTSQVKKVYEYLYDKISKENPSYYTTQLVNQTVDRLLKTSYSNYKEIREKISGKYRHGSCVITGIFDMLKPEHITLFKELGDIYKQVYVGVIDDKISSAFLGHDTVFNENQRASQLINFKGITSSSVINGTNVKIENDIGPLQLDEPEKKKYDIGYISGVFDGFNPGHLEHLNMAKAETENLYIGIKTDKYSKRIKNKFPINDENDRLKVVSGVRGVYKVFLTDTDMLPPREFLDKAKEVIKNGGRVAIYLGSDWITKFDSKPKSSIDELNFIRKKYPKIFLTTTKRENEKTMSSTVLREQLIQSKEIDTFPLELTMIGNDYEL